MIFGRVRLGTAEARWQIDEQIAVLGHAGDRSRDIHAVAVGEERVAHRHRFAGERRVVRHHRVAVLRGGGGIEDLLGEIDGVARNDETEPEQALAGECELDTAAARASTVGERRVLRERRPNECRAFVGGAVVGNCGLDDGGVDGKHDGLRRGHGRRQRADRALRVGDGGGRSGRRGGRITRERVGSNDLVHGRHRRRRKDIVAEEDDRSHQDDGEGNATRFHGKLKVLLPTRQPRCQGTGSKPPGRNGWQRPMRRRAIHAPRRAPCLSSASIA